MSSDGDEWISAPRSKKGGRLYLFPVQALSAVFRGKYLDGLRKLHARGKLKPDPKACPGGVPEGFETLVSSLREKGWVVYCKEPFAGPEQVLAYLSRYTHRVAIRDGRILKLDTETPLSVAQSDHCA